MKHRLAAALSCVALASGLAACGGGSDPSSPSMAWSGADHKSAITPDPLQKYREQTVHWTECDPDLLEDEDEDLKAVALEMGSRLRCAIVSAPLDWSDTARGDIDIGMMRLEAAQPERRRGALLFNPGGPGGDGLSESLRLSHAFKDIDPSDPRGAKQLRLLDEYDMVGFSPRGVGASSQLQCAGNDGSAPLSLDRVNCSADGWNAPENLARIFNNAGEFARACQQDPMRPYINTDATARDMDLLRGLLGEEKLNYVGVSYGTWLGAWYASLFPDKVGRMVLDSVMDFTLTLEEADFVTGPASQRLVDEVLVPYAARHHRYFGLGGSEAEVRATLQNLSPEVRAQLDSRGDLLSSPLSADQFLLAMSAARGLDAILKSDAMPLSSFHTLEVAVEGYEFHHSSKEIDADTREIAVAMAAGYFFDRMQPSKKTKQRHLDAFETVMHAVRCNDTPASTDTFEWLGKVSALAQHVPTFLAGDSDTLLASAICLFWGGPSVAKPDLAPMKPLDVLFVQSQYDVATPEEGASAFFAKLPQARRVYVAGDFTHGVFASPTNNACVNALVTDYLLGESPVERDTVCQATPLKLDALSPDVGLGACAARRPPAEGFEAKRAKNEYSVVVPRSP